jgi:hypothetical protein
MMTYLGTMLYLSVKAVTLSEKTAELLKELR